MFNFDPDDPRKLGLMMAAAHLLQGAPGQRKNIGADLSHGLMGGLMGYAGGQQGLLRKQEAQDAAEERKMRLAQMKQAEADRVATRGAMQTAFGQPNVNLMNFQGQPMRDDEGGAIPQVPGGGGMPEFLRLAGGNMDPMQAIGLMQKQGPMKVGKDDRLVDPTTFKEVLGAAPGEQWEDIGRDPKTGQHMQRNKLTGQMKAVGTMPPSVSVNLPAPEKAILKADSDRLDELSASAASARKFAQTSRVINGLLKNSGGGGLVKIGTETARFLGMKSGDIAANDLAESLNTRLATEVRMPGSGSTSNIEFEAYRQAGPSLRNSHEGREMMAEGAMKFAERQAKLADKARELIRQGKYSDQAMVEYDEKLGSVLGDAFKKKIGAAGGGVRTYDAASGTFR